MHECDLLVRSVQVHTSREERVCVCVGGGRQDEACFWEECEESTNV